MTVRQRGSREDPSELLGLVYGTHLRGNLPVGFRPYLWPPEQTVAARRALEVSYREVDELPAIEEIWAAEPGPRTFGRFALCRQPDGVGLTVAGDGSGWFRLTRGAIAIEWQPGGAGAAHYFFSYALPLWLETRGIPVLHASAVAFGDRAVALVGKSSVGKSTLGAALVRSGCLFVADDGLPLREDAHGDWRCAHGPPLFKLWPSALEGRLGVAAAGLPRVHDSLEKRLLPRPVGEPARPGDAPRLAAVYVLERQPESAGPVTASGRSARQSLVHLIEHSLAGGPVAALGLSPRRLEQLARVAARVPVRRLRYPSGDLWPRIRRVILEELDVS